MMDENSTTSLAAEPALSQDWLARGFAAFSSCMPDWSRLKTASGSSKENSYPADYQNPPARVYRHEIRKDEVIEETLETQSKEGKTLPSASAVEEIDTTPKHSTAVLTKPVSSRREAPPPNPLLLDPYQWERCTITVGYSLLIDGTVSVSVHNHKDEPIVRIFPPADVPLPEKISKVITPLQTIWPASPVNITVVLLPKQEEAAERAIIASARVATDTPIVQEGVESDFPLPTPILTMLDELKALIPERGLKNIEKNAKTKAITAARSTAKPAARTGTPGDRNIRKDQMTLF
jgi:hypothetical protein